MNKYQSVASAEPTAEIRYKTAIQISVFFLPSLSEGMPPNKAPTTVPKRAIEMVSPCSKAESPHNIWMSLSAPEITAVSKPNKKPPNATTIDQKNTLPKFIEEIFPHNIAGLSLNGGMGEIIEGLL
jgi:hypothetical protein